MKRLPFLLLGLMAAVIALATLVEDSRGTDMAHRLIYGTVWFRLLWAAIVGAGLWRLWAYCCARRSSGIMRHLPLIAFHLSLVLILLGALLTSLTGQRGVMHLRKGIPVDEFVTHQTQRVKLPFLVRLDDFQVLYYEGTAAPQDYRSHVQIEGQAYAISMNKVATHRGYRFYQSSYDSDMEGSILSVNYDPWGTPTTYLGYALLGLSMMLYTLPLRRKRTTMAMLALLLALTTSAAPRENIIPAEQAEAMARRQVVWNERPTPMGAMAQEFVLKVHGRRSYQGLTPMQMVVDMMMRPMAWIDEPFIKAGRGEYRSPRSFVNPDTGRLDGLGRDAKVDERVGLTLMLLEGTLVHPLPKDAPRLSGAKVSAELFYHLTDWTLWGMVGCLLVMGCLVVGRLSFRKSLPALARLLGGLVAFYLLAVWLLRWYIAGHIPLSNGFETMLFVALCLMGVGTVRRGLLAGASGGAACMLFVAHLGVMNPQITPLMPVLHSPWLSAHVSIIMLSYSLLALSIVDRSLLRPAVFCLSAGIFLGAVWAGESWGTYWSWDPKESWALITLLVYSLPLHRQSLPWFQSLVHYRLYSILALATLLMTYFGVNFLLGGMHSYGA